MLKSVALLMAASLLVAVAPAPISPVPPRIPVDVFAAFASYEKPQISPDGKQVLALARANGAKVVIVYNIDSGSDRLTRLQLGEKLEVMDARWAGNRRILLSIFGTRKAAGIEVPMTRLFVRDLDSGATQVLGEGKVGGLFGGDIVFVDPAGAYVLLAGQRDIWEFPSVFRVDLATLKAQQVAPAQSGVWKWYADPSGSVRAGLGTDSDTWWLYYRDREGDRFRRISGKRPANATLFDLDTLIPVAGSSQGYVIANKATGRYGVYRYDFSTDTIGDPVFERPDVDVDSLASSLRTGQPDAVLYTDDRERIAWLDKDMRLLQARLDRALPGRINRVVSRDSADERMIVHSSAASDPGIYYLYEASKRALTELARPYPELQDKPLAPVEPVRYAARDGLSIPAYLTKPIGRGDKGLPLVVMPHGGPFVRDKWDYEPWAQFLANRGYVVLQPNYRGSTGYGKAFVDAASGEFGRKMQDDLDDGVRWLTGSGLVDPKRVCILGASYGGYAAMWAAVRNPDVYRCAISFAGISDVRAILRYDPSGWVARRYYRDWRDRIRGDSKFDVEKVSPLKHAAELRIPILLAHGQKDKRVPVEQTVKLHQALASAGRPHEFVLYPEEGHGFAKVEDSKDFLTRVERFLAENNPAQ
jgi:dipeptidyl aminopeptidase/acylaminoacyl peptidase